MSREEVGVLSSRERSWLDMWVWLSLLEVMTKPRGSMILSKKRVQGGEKEQGHNFVIHVIFGSKVRREGVLEKPITEGKFLNAVEGGRWGRVFKCYVYQIVRLAHTLKVTIPPAGGNAGRRQSSSVAGRKSQCGRALAESIKMHIAFDPVISPLGLYPIEVKAAVCNLFVQEYLLQHCL